MISPPNSNLEQKIERWRQNLLDMTLRNRLLNFKTRSAVQMLRPGTIEIYDRLVGEGGTMTVRAMAEEERVQDPLDSLELMKDEVLPMFDAREVDAALKKIRLRARGSVKEQGVNILFMAFGLVSWYEDPESEKELLSPLVLVPVELIKEGPLFPYRIRTIDEDIVVNPNLAYKLKTEFGLSLPPWPEEPGSLASYLDQARESLAPARRWKIADGAFLGLFSFAKLSMYQELLTEQERLSQHPLINALAGNPSLLPPIPDYPKAEMLDKVVRPSDSYQILDADSSQQEAIEMAKRGISFVLQGPPGTGKSQTISNIITEALALDKKVLFVSEKMAALEVVKRRLEEKGLADYIMEIHSRKANKTAVMDELRRCMQPASVPGGKIEDLQRLERVRDDLNQYVQALHEVQSPLDRSAFMVQGRLAALHDVPELEVIIPSLASISSDDLDDQLKYVRRVQVALPIIERMDKHTWRDLKTERWNAGKEAVVGTELRDLQDRVKRLGAITTEMSELTGHERPTNVMGGRKMIELLRRTAPTPYPMEDWLVPGRPETLQAQCDTLQEGYAQKFKDEQWMAGNYRDNVLSLDVSAMLGRFENEHKGFLRFLSSKFKQDRSLLQSHRKDGQRPSYAAMVNDLRELVALEDRARSFKRMEADASDQIGPRFRGAGTDWTELRSSLAWTSSYNKALDLPLTPQLKRMLCQPNGSVPRLDGLVQKGEEAVNEVTRSQGAMDDLFSIREAASMDDVPFEQWEEFARRHLTDLGSMREWVEISSLERTCSEMGMGDLFLRGRKGMLLPEGLEAAYEKHFLQLWLDHILSKDVRLRDFRSADHDETIALFRQLDEKQMDIARKRLRAKLNKDVENVLDGQIHKGSELSILKHEIAKKKRFKQIRQLFQECPHIIQGLKPCLLMSPLSVSQFLDPATVGFDIVIFDEASQVRPEDAVGSIMRGTQVIVVGDSMQLPPTSFFKTEMVEDEDDVDDLESILDECTVLNLKQHMLLWHYRSKHESLIAFSNNRIYDGRLNTFPSAGHQVGEWGVTSVLVPQGIYDRGNTKTNLAEAKKVTELVFDHFARTPERSLGVIAFSESQQMAILDQIDEKRKQRPEFEKYFTEDEREEFFVKNLENVQGDERDVMIFSVGYGRDQQGRIYQNFGPLNKAGGERRLNVAITRARMHIKLVTSIGAEDVEGSTSQGARLLKDYLAYAASGGSRVDLLDDQDQHDEDDPVSSFEDEVYRVLTKEGLSLQRRVGCSAYRIDLAVQDLSTPGSFLLGIVCDGPSYSSGRTARDRDRLREKVLQGLGWNIHRIWSRDWLIDRDREVGRILSAVEKAKEAQAPSRSLGDEQAVRVLGMRPNDDLSVDAELAPLRTSLLELVRKEGPIHLITIKERVGPSWPRAQDIDLAISTCLEELNAEEEAILRDGFIWPAGMTKPPVRRPDGAAPMVVERVALEEIGEAALYVMGSDLHISIALLIDRTARFYRHEVTMDQVRSRIASAIDRLVATGLLVTETNDAVRRASRPGSP